MRKSPLVSVKKKEDFKRIFGRGKSAAEPLFVVYALANDLGFNRLGLSVSKKVGNAVRRNRVKRLVKESCRLLFAEKNGQARHVPGFDFIVAARVPAGELPREGAFVKVSDTLTRLFGQLGVNV